MAAPQRAATGALSLTTAAPRRCACSFSTRAARSRPRHIYPATTAATAIHTIESRRRLDDSFPFYPRWHAITAAAPFSTTDSRSSSSSSTFSFARPDDATAFPSETERAILSAALGKGHVSAHGFTAAALAAGAADAGFNSSSSAAAAAAIHGGEFALVRWHLVTARGRLKERAKVLFDGEGGEGEGRLDVGKKIEMLCWERLMINRHIVHRWQEALALMALPSNVPASLKELALLADEIWYLAGDTAVDSSWYTKRGSVAAVYAAAELFMTTDPDVQKTCGTGPTESTLVTGRDGANTAAAGERKDDGGGNEHHRVPDNEFAETRRFLQSRLAEVQDVGAAVGSVAQWLGFTAQSGVNVLRSKGFRI